MVPAHEEKVFNVIGKNKYSFKIIIIIVMDWNFMKDDIKIGEVDVDFSGIKNETKDEWYNLKTAKDPEATGKSKIRLRIRTESIQ